MRENYFDPLVGLAVVGLCCVAFMLGVAFSNGFTWNDVLGAITAVGTVAAVLVALWTSNATASRLRREQRDLAVVTAASIAAPLSLLVTSLRTQCLNGLAIHKKTRSTPSADAHSIAAECTANAADIVKAIAALRTQIDVKDLRLLVPLGQRYAAQCARGIATLEGIADTLNRLLIDDVWDAWPPFGKTMLHEHWMELLDNAIDLLAPLQSECHRIVGREAPAPTEEELYPDPDMRAMLKLLKGK